ncbi:2-amino-4-hydroxy-6-hydroxymethyldihydropteridine diphosphokinase [Pontiella sulfatireligans]|uniref:2-amino-4-hydroxy-6-hydroxymethyldihydropteridine pyrophosphokinase n=1 Tax=Pontiella sulfatireligans TaxID=2750658 RepID=A0A6C2US10_9BACT|nr:2-amino-4-hydroxy-6-hydroxymethyldihydropteridine diphosphokinase [Pontiella sulfatireligans]VGO23095.1 2-amino-4-hydroxy-6-hydroxymethyldihydropteridinepyrophosphokinase [Pontiella sulfatireligans]
MEIGFSLGSNLYNRKRLLMQAKNLLLSAPRTSFVDQSPIYETTPVDVKPEYQDMAYLNSVVLVESELPLESWLSYIGKIEANLGRERNESDRNAPRPIDVDIIYAGDQIIDSGGLEVPHPRWAERRFVVQPLCDVRPELVLPEASKSVAEILRSLPPDHGLSIFDEKW